MKAGGAQLSLAFGELARRLPASWPRIVFYASGSNSPGEIRGFAALGIPVGFCAGVIGGPGLQELERQKDTGLMVFGDSGAYSEVALPRTGRGAVGHEHRCRRMAVVRAITPEQWGTRLEIYERIAASYGGRFAAVAPDLVGDQEGTLRRVFTYRATLHNLANAGAKLLLPLHQGVRGLAAFHEEVEETLGIGMVPAFPMLKGTTPLPELMRFVATRTPPEIHLLGLGIRSPRARTVLPLLARSSPMTFVTMDANLITASVGRKENGSAARPLTAAQDEITAQGHPRSFRDISDASWDIHTDYTDAISDPAEWLGPAALRQVAAGLGLTREQTARWVRDPAVFLQQQVAGSDSIRWWENPAMSGALDHAWYEYVDRLHANARRAEAIRMAFAMHPAAGQFRVTGPTAAREVPPLQPAR